MSGSDDDSLLVPEVMGMEEADSDERLKSSLEPQKAFACSFSETTCTWREMWDLSSVSSHEEVLLDDAFKPAEVVTESSLQAQFAEQTAAEMADIVQYWSAPTPRNMPENSLSSLEHPYLGEYDAIATEKLVDELLQRISSLDFTIRRQVSLNSSLEPPEMIHVGSTMEQSSNSSALSSHRTRLSSFDTSSLATIFALIPENHLQEELLQVGEDTRSIAWQQKLETDRICLDTKALALVPKTMCPIKPDRKWCLSTTGWLDVCQLRIQFRLQQLYDYVALLFWENVSFECFIICMGMRTGRYRRTSLVRVMMMGSLLFLLLLATRRPHATFNQGLVDHTHQIHESSKCGMIFESVATGLAFSEREQFRL